MYRGVENFSTWFSAIGKYNVDYLAMDNSSKSKCFYMDKLVKGRKQKKKRRANSYEHRRN